MSHPSVAGQQPRPPADAYHRVASMLPESYFTEPPPPSGTIVQAKGRDGIWTEWAMSDELAHALIQGLVPHRRSVIVRATPYLPRRV